MSESAADDGWMQLALEQARVAASIDEVPVGAVLVLDERLIAIAHNRCETERDATAHAEILALREGRRSLKTKRLEGTTLYCTLEPCFQCCGAILLTRVSRVVFGARDPKFGGVRSLAELLDHPRANHRAQIEEGLRAEESSSLLSTFFRNLRHRAKTRDASLRDSDLGYGSSDVDGGREGESQSDAPTPPVPDDL